MLDIPTLEPRLANRPFPWSNSRRPEDVRGTDLAICSPVKNICLRVDVVHGIARWEAEPEARGLAGAVVSALRSVAL